MRCPLCADKRTQPYHTDQRRDYRQCCNCRLVFVPKEQHLNDAQEKAEYDLHQNHIEDPGYRAFLSRLFLPMTAKLPPPAEGLDFGCGPGPALARMFEEDGYKMQVYDKFYANNTGVLARQYDFISCTEVVEHLSQPGETLDSLFALIKPGGWLGVMTKLVIEKTAFARWHYKNDLTHINFFSRETFEYLANHWGCGLEFVGKDVILMQKHQ
ncbi:MAG: hypothetical protein AMJ53_00590 [Gammaproteobacteria bacterium SG8_11]|nr:MAG: hypothetical protein AMJ53_00590 [Gammaproteobacteria bacterium SG8_11]